MKELIELAKKASLNSYSPYSNFKVGVALLTKDNKIYTGCNIESVSYTPTCCAERVAFFKAISDGNRDFESIAVVGGQDGNFDNFCFPCGVCRQVMNEFCDKDFKIYVTDGKEIKTYLLKDLLPYSFGNGE